MSKPRSGPKFESINKSRLELLEKDDEMFRAFITDITKAADTRKSGTMKETRIKIRKTLEHQYRTEKKIDIKSIRRNYELLKDTSGLKRDTRLSDFDRSVEKREKQFMEEYRLVSCMVTFAELDRIALAEILDIKGIHKNPDAIDAVINIYESAKQLLSKTCDLKVADDFSTPKTGTKHDTVFVRAPFAHIDLSEVSSLAIWLKEYIHREINLSERHIIESYQKEHNTSSAWESMLDLLNRQLQKALNLLRSLLREPHLALPAPTKNDFSSIEIARTRMEHISTLFSLMLVWIDENPGIPLGTEIHRLVEKYREKSGQK